MQKTIVFIDCETTSLRHDRRAWEVAVVLRRPGQPDHAQSWMIERADLDLGNADLASLNFGRFFERHPSAKDGATRGVFTGYMHSEVEVLLEVERLTRGAVLMGSNPSFDAETLASRMRAHGICPSFHYHHMDVPTLALGWLYGHKEDIPDDLKSDAISAACGVSPERYERHTALGDCEWQRDLFDVVTGSRPAW